jgi:Cft2 family RNA processing exonuclease
MLDLSSNRFKYLVPPTTSNAALTALKLPSLLSLNISDNPIVNVRQVVNALAQLAPNLTDLQVSLFTEEDVDYIIRKLANLKYLNNIAVERTVEDQFYESHDHS